MRLINKKELSEYYFEEMSVSEVLEYVKQHLTIVPSKKQFNKKILDIIDPKLIKQELEVICLDVIKDEKSQEYYDSKWQKEDVYIVYELNHNYLNSNCNLLVLEMNLLRGISLNDIENKTNRYVDYMCSIRHLVNKEY